jgi:N,N-dimethylformamidase beta subunit-like protein/IPT/TIG domain-containing protein
MTAAEFQPGPHTCRRAGLLLGVLALIALLPTSTLTQSNPIVVENQQPGSNGWTWTKVADDVNKQIKGYASATSINQNENITFYVSVNPPQPFTIDFYRFGWYGGLGGRLQLHVGPIDGIQQATCPMDASTGMIVCDWMPSYTLNVPSSWTSGVYAAKLINSQGYENYVTFVVKDRRPAPFLYQQGVTTDDAYNNYPNDGLTGKSLYTFNSYGPNTISGNPAAVKVSFDRPRADSGLGNFHKWELNFIRWLERMGYDTTYSTNIDTHASPGDLLSHKAFLIAGHDEYWSKEMRDAVEAARDAGVHIGVFAANTSYTQIRLEPSATAVPNRVIVEYRNFPWAPTDPVQGPTTTTEFRLPPVNRPEQTLLGTQFVGSMANVNYVVINSSHWVYAGTGFNDGDAVPGLVGYEADGFMSNYPPPNTTNQTLLGRSPFLDWAGNTIYANSSIYQAPSGAWVFNAGTISWSWGLDDVPGSTAQGKVDVRIQQTTANLLNAFLNGAVPPPPTSPTITSLTPTSGPAGTSVTIGGTNFTGATAVTFNGTAATFTVTSDTAIQTSVPSGATTGPVRVTTPAGTATSVANFFVIAAPTITSFTPTSGAPGGAVTISGTNFTGTSTVTFNGTAATFTVLSGTAIQANVPAGATTGPIAVTNPAGTATSAANFTVSSGPAITGFTPASGTGGTSVTISGANLTGATAVAFNGTAAAFTVTSDTEIQATVPDSATTGPLSVTTPAGTATSAGTFTVAPTITSFTPTSGAAGAAITISGTNLTGASSVAFHGTAANFTVTSATAIQATVPSGATTGLLSVTTPGGTANSATVFAVAPTITSFSPASGPLGTSVTIGGMNFTGATSVTFNGSAAMFTVTSDTAIQTQVPADATTGPLRVTTGAGTATSTTDFSVSPTISGFTPTSGAAGAAVTITGTALTGATAVKFNGTSAGYTVLSNTSIQATVPTGATTGPLSVTTPGGTATSAANFVAAPTIASFSPATGPLGTVVTVTGLNYTGTTAVKFNGVSATNFAIASPTSIQAIVPTGATTGRITVTTAAGTATSAANFTVTAVLSVRKTSGPLGIGNGTITSSSGGINCGPTCSATYNTISVVTLTATADVLSIFNGWTGCDTVNGNLCTVTINRARSVVANFLP